MYPPLSAKRAPCSPVTTVAAALLVESPEYTTCEPSPVA